MELVTGKQAASRITGMINPKFQVHAYAVNLTVRQIYEVDPVGQVDFGGSEYRRAGKIAVGTRRRTPEDKYQWWELGRGAYFVEFNESVELAENEIAWLEPDERLLRAGASHAAQFLRGRVAPVEALLDVDTIRLQVKQNARISRIRVFRFDTSAAGAGQILPSTPVTPKKVRKKKPARG